MFDRLLSRRLSGQLLLITIVFVMIAEVLIFIPSAAMFRQNWLMERAEAAGLLTLSIEGVPDYESSQRLSAEFMQGKDVSMVAQKRDGMSQVVLGMPPTGKKIYLVDLREERRLPLFRESFRDFFEGGDAYIRILSHPTVPGVEALEVLVPQSALKMAMIDYCKRVLLWSLAISVLTGLMVYTALSRMIVRPVQKLAAGLARFRKDPRKRKELERPVTRKDEIGQLEREFIDMKDGVRETFKQQERMATLGMAMAKINHDLRNVLSAAQLISDRLAGDPEERVKVMGERLVKAVERGVKLCDATLSFSQSAQEHPQPRPTRLAALIGEAAADSLHDSVGIVFENKIDTNLQAYIDPDHTYRIFHNLCRNAVQAMVDSPVKTLTVSAECADDKINVSITDSGPGLPERARENLFKAFTSSVRKGGTGLGLTIARELARAQGGNLLLERTDATGTVFIVSLPMQSN